LGDDELRDGLSLIEECDWVMLDVTALSIVNLVTNNEEVNESVSNSWVLGQSEVKSKRSLSVLSTWEE
jgi:hypothetical protein